MKTIIRIWMYTPNGTVWYQFCLDWLSIVCFRLENISYIAIESGTQWILVNDVTWTLVSPPDQWLWYLVWERDYVAHAYNIIKWRRTQRTALSTWVNFVAVAKAPFSHSFFLFKTTCSTTIWFKYSPSFITKLMFVTARSFHSPPQAPPKKIQKGAWSHSGSTFPYVLSQHICVPYVITW